MWPVVGLHGVYINLIFETILHFEMSYSYRQNGAELDDHGSLGSSKGFEISKAARSDPR